MTEKQIERIAHRIVREAIIDGRLVRRLRLKEYVVERNDYCHIAFMAYCEGYEQCLADTQRLIKKMKT